MVGLVLKYLRFESVYGIKMWRRNTEENLSNYLYLNASSNHNCTYHVILKFFKEYN